MPTTEIVREAPPPEYEDAPDNLIGIVVELLDTQGYEAVQLREVARRARMSLATIYKRYRTRDELIVAALEWWLNTNRYAELRPSTALAADATLYDGLMRIFRIVFEPWEAHPRLLKSYFRAQSGPGGDRLTKLGFDSVGPAALDVLAHADPRFARDLGSILTNVVYGVLGQLAADAIDVADVLPEIERAVFWLVDGRSQRE